MLAHGQRNLLEEGLSLFYFTHNLFEHALQILPLTIELECKFTRNILTLRFAAMFGAIFWRDWFRVGKARIQTRVWGWGVGRFIAYLSLPNPRINDKTTYNRCVNECKTCTDGHAKHNHTQEHGHIQLDRQTDTLSQQTDARHMQYRYMKYKQAPG